MRPLDILAWHTHGSDLDCLTQARHRFHVLSKPGRPPGYGGRCGRIPWGDNVHDLLHDDHQFDKDQCEFLGAALRQVTGMRAG